MKSTRPSRPLSDRLREALYGSAFAVIIGTVWAIGWADAEETKVSPNCYGCPHVDPAPPLAAADAASVD